MSDAPAAVTFTATLQPRGPAAAVLLDDARLAEIGGGAKTPPVRVTVNGHTFQGRIGRMGGETLLGFNKAVRAACGVEAGDEIELTVVRDDGPREVALPPELATALAADAELHARFEALAPVHRKEFARWVGEARREETRDKRLAETLTMVREGRTRR